MVGVLTLSLIAACVSDLGSDEFGRRQASELALEQLADAALLILLEAQEDEDCEVRRRAGRIVAAYVDSVRPKDRWPWIDSLPADFPSRRHIIDTYLARSRGPDGTLCYAPDFFAYREATRQFITVRLLTNLWPRQRCRELLAEMVKGDAKYMTEHGYYYGASR